MLINIIPRNVHTCNINIPGDI